MTQRDINRDSLSYLDHRKIGIIKGRIVLDITHVETRTLNARLVRQIENISTY